MVEIRSTALAELIRLSPGDKRELASWLRAEALKADAQAEPAEPPGDPEEVTVAEVNTIRERLRRIEPYTRGRIIDTFRNDLVDDMVGDTGEEACKNG